MRKGSRRCPKIVAMMLAASSLCAQETNLTWQSKELVRFEAPEAVQGVAVDADFFYAIANREIAKYRKKDGARATVWKDREGGDIIHLNSGVVKDGKLYAAHSNYPQVPMVSSVEIWDAKMLKHIDSHKLGKIDGSLTWLDYHDGRWYAGFAHYAKKGGVPGRGPEQTRVVQFDNQWRVVREWMFPREIIARFAPNSCSCGGFGPGGLLYATGHDAKEMYALRLSRSPTMQWITTVPVGFEGQGFAWDPAERGVVWGISRKAKQVVATRISPLDHKDQAQQQPAKLRHANYPESRLE